MIFGKNRDKGIRINRDTLALEVVTLGNGIGPDDLLVHDEHAAHPNLAFLLSNMIHPEFPECVGVLRSVRQPTFDELVHQQTEDAVAKKGRGKLDKLFASEDMWVVKPSDSDGCGSH
jgi:2-oxoglutarate ferredoxin oxidoreductase subunit beta